MSLNVELLESSFNLLAPRADELADRFYDRLFTKYPQVRPMFPDDVSEQKKKLVAALAMIVGNLRKPEALGQAVADLGIRHIDYGVTRDQYPVVGENLLATLAELAGDAWNPELEQAWADAYGAITQIIYAALDEHEAKRVA